MKRDVSGRMSHSQNLSIPNTPPLPGLTFRHFQGKKDYPAMVDVLEKSKEADSIQHKTSVERIARSYDHLHNCDPYTDMLFAEIHGEVIGYSRIWWRHGGETRRYCHFALLLPEWRGKGIRRCMLLYNEKRAREIAAAHPEDNKVYEAQALETEPHWITLLLQEQYTPVRYFSTMVRPLNKDIPELPLPQGLEIRPVNPEHYQDIWDALNKAFQDHWAGSPLNNEEIQEWVEDPSFNPGIWQVAWDTHENQVAGAVLNFIDEEENREYNRDRAHMGPLGVRRPYRQKGLAKALIARSFAVLKTHGITDVALGVDSDNPTGAFNLYETMGFSTVETSVKYHKPID
jgi:mycothiol synthase